jgi:hypothetical protein
MPPFVSFNQLKKDGIFSNRPTLARAIDQVGFPRPVELGKNRLGWDMQEVSLWLASRPRRSPKYTKRLSTAGARDSA